MKATGIVRKMDNLGRLVIPSEIRKTFGFDKNQELEIFIDGQTVIIGRYYEKCFICDGDSRLTSFDNKMICCDCVNRIGKIS